MNKKGSIITLVSLKTYFILIAIVALLIWGYSLYTRNQLGLGAVSDTCNKDIIPDRINLIQSSNDGSYRSPTGWYTNDVLQKWKDGTNMTGFYCYNAQKPGENIKYIYCRDIGYINAPIKEDGTLGKKIELKITLAVDTNDKTEEGYKIMGAQCKSLYALF